MSGRLPLFLIAVLAAFVLLTQGLPALLAAFRQGPPPFPADEVRDAGYAGPEYEAALLPNGKYEKKLRVFGPSITAHYTEEVPRAQADLPPPVHVVAQPGEMIVIPTGETIRLAAIAVTPSLPDERGRYVGFEPEKVLYSPDGGLMSEEEAKSFLFRANGYAEEYQAYGSLTHLDRFQLGIMIEAELGHDRIISGVLRDGRTGGVANISNSGDTRSTNETHDRSRLFSHTLSFGVAGVRSPPLELHLVIHGGDPVFDEFPLGPQFDISFHDGPAQIRGYWAGPYHEYRRKNRELTQKELASPESLQDDSRHKFTIEFDRLPKGFSSVKVILKNGTELSSRSHEWGTNGGKFDFDAFYGDVKTIRVVSYTKPVRVVLKLPNLPTYPKQNRGRTDIAEMELPDLTLNNDRELQTLIGNVLQANMLVENRLRAAATTPNAFYPLQTRGMTVGELLQLYRGAFPANEVVLESGPEGSVVSLRPAGATRTARAPQLAVLYRNLSSAWIVASIVMSVLGLWKILLLVRASVLRRALMARGYTWLTLWQAEWLVVSLGRGAWRIPPYDELGAVPGVDPDKVESIAQVVWKARR